MVYPECSTFSILPPPLIFEDVYCIDGWRAYQRHLPEAVHEVGKRKTQKIERKHLRLRTRIKRLARKTICFSKSEEMHERVIGLFINWYEFDLLDLDPQQ